MPKKVKDSYAAILKETEEVVKKIAVLRRDVRRTAERVGGARDKSKIEKIRKGLGL